MPDGARFCTKCGTPVAAAPAAPQVEKTTLGDVTGLAALKAKLEKAEAKVDAPAEEAPKADEAPKTEE